MSFQYGDVLTHEEAAPFGADKVMFVALTDDCAKHSDGTPCVRAVDLSRNYDPESPVECYVHNGWTKVEDK